MSPDVREKLEFVLTLLRLRGTDFTLIDEERTAQRFTCNFHVACVGPGRIKLWDGNSHIRCIDHALA